MKYKILPTIKSSSDVSKLNDVELELLCNEIRDKLIEVVSNNGGHLSPNLGVVELIVAIHKNFNFPEDSIVFDVGHQSYTHKMLTGRYELIDTIRTKGGLSGFPKLKESECDSFIAGHASTSISAAFGICKAKQLKGDNSYTIAFIGDGSLTGGEAFEGLNNAGRYNKNFIVILNDNKMSISKNVGAMARYLTSIRVNPWYIRFKMFVEKGLSHLPILGRPISKGLKKSKSKIKRAVLKDTIFDKLGFSYYGPVDGHDLDALNNALYTAKKSKDPCLIHVITKKGKGYTPAETDSASFHGIGQFDIATGEPLNNKKSFSSAFGDSLCELASKNEKILGVTAAMRTGTGLKEFSKKYKDRFFDVGIAEQHAVTFSAGLATKGFIPVFAVYSTFLQRAYDQLLHDVAMQNLHVVLGVDRAGVVGEDGETHQGLFDVSILSTVPDTVIYSPSYFDELNNCMYDAVEKDSSLVAVRYPRGGESYRPSSYELSTNYSMYGYDKSDILLITYGRLFSNAAKACDELHENGIDIKVMKLCKIKPIDSECIDIAKEYKKIYFFEEGILSGGIAQIFKRLLDEKGFSGNYDISAVDDEFVQHASVIETLTQLGLDKNSMIKKIKEGK